MKMLSQVLGVERWTQVVQSDLRILNGVIDYVTIGDIIDLANLFGITIEEMTRLLYTEMLSDE